MATARFRQRSSYINHAILIFMALTIILPLLVLAFNSIKPSSEFGANPLGFPNEIRLMNYYDAWVNGNYTQIFMNSLTLVIGTLILNLTVSGLAAFSLAVLNPRGIQTIVVGLYLLVGISIPAQLFILPLFLMWKSLYLLDTRIGLIIIYSALNAPFATFLIRSYMLQLPTELFEAAKLDGASVMQLFTRVALPLSWPVFLTTALIVSLTVWNEFLFAITFIITDEYKPISSILFTFQSRFANDYGLVSAASILMAAPIAILFMFFQRRFIAGLTSGATKGYFNGRKMELNKEYQEKVYSGVLGKIIGVYLGRPFEGWWYDRIIKELGPINLYVNDKLNMPIQITDDDLTGTFRFINALKDFNFDKNISSKQIGQTWLNYCLENQAVLWWGGKGTSSEDTAYQNLKQGIHAPDSGSIKTNGKIVAEQIGAQIFIDGWGLVSPGDPDQAADFAKKAGSVSHDGESVYAAQVVAAMEAMAFIEKDTKKIIEHCKRYIPKDSTIFKLISDIQDWSSGNFDWEQAREKIDDIYGYEKFIGGVHIVPNHALIILAFSDSGAVKQS